MRSVLAVTKQTLWFCVWCSSESVLLGMCLGAWLVTSPLPWTPDLASS